MNATTVDVAGRQLAIHPQRTLLGLRNLLRKDAIDWLLSKRPWIVIVVSLFIFIPAAANSRINEWIIRSFPTAETSSKVVSLQPMDNLMQAIGTQFIVIAVIFATMSLLLAERDGGTLAWTISKPVSRTSVLVSKWITSTLRHVGRGGRDPARGHHGPGERPLRDARHGDRGHSGRGAAGGSGALRRDRACRGDARSVAHPVPPDVHLQLGDRGDGRGIPVVGHADRLVRGHGGPVPDRAKSARRDGSVASIVGRVGHALTHPAVVTPAAVPRPIRS